MAHRTKGRLSLDRTARVALLAGAVMFCGQLHAQQAGAATGDKPNIIVIWGDDIGRSNLSTFTEGMMQLAYLLNLGESH